MDATVKGLMISPFSSRTEEAKLEIVKHGKPQPVINKYVFINSERIPVSKLYDLEMWLTACIELDSIICWTCLLYPIIDAENKCFIGGITDKCLEEHILQHKRSIFHIIGVHRYCLFIEENLPSRRQVEEKSKQEIKGELNYGMFKKIIYVLCYLAEDESIPVEVTSTYDIFNIENCFRVLISLTNDDKCVVTEETINVIRKHPQIMIKIIETIADIMKMDIKEEIRQCSQVSLILSQHTGSSKLSLILRYIYNGSICERFITFIDAANVDLIKSHVLHVVSEYEISSKLLSFSCDSGVLTNANIRDLLAWLHDLYPFCIYVPCHLHDINLSLEKRLSNIKTFKSLISKINSMKKFFQANAELCKTLKQFVKKIPNLYDLQLSNFQFLGTLKLYRRQFRAFFSHIIEKYENLNRNELVQAMGFQCLLEEYQVVFLIEAIYLLFTHVAVLRDLFNSGSPEKALEANILDSVEAALVKEKSGFGNLWTLVINELVKDCNLEALQTVGKIETEHLLGLYRKAIDCIIEEINVRFKCSHKLEFLSILNCEAHDKLLVSECQMKQIQQIRGDFIDKEQVVTEMKVLSKNGWIFGAKSVYEFMEILTRLDMRHTFPNIYRLGEIILALPCKPSCSPESPPKFDLINAWASKSNEPGMESKSLLAVEKDFLKYVRSQSFFHENLFLKFHGTGAEVKE